MVHFVSTGAHLCGSIPLYCLHGGHRGCQNLSSTTQMCITWESGGIFRNYSSIKEQYIILSTPFLSRLNHTCGYCLHLLPKSCICDETGKSIAKALWLASKLVFASHIDLNSQSTPCEPSVFGMYESRSKTTFSKFFCRLYSSVFLQCGETTTKMKRY